MDDGPHLIARAVHLFVIRGALTGRRGAQPIACGIRIDFEMRALRYDRNKSSVAAVHEW
jgi:hypothetical protein